MGRVFIIFVGVMLLSGVLLACAAGPRIQTGTLEVSPSVMTYIDTQDPQEANRLFDALLGYPVPSLLKALQSPRDDVSVPTGVLPGRTIRVNGKPGRYGLYVPPNYESSRDYPLMICLHGAGFNGDSYLERWQPRLGDRYLLACPTFEFGAWWTKEAEALVLAVMEAVMRDYRVDPDRVLLAGMSNGAIGTYLIGLNHADRFAALVAMAGALPDPLLALLDNARGTPLYLIHGVKDQVIPSKYSRTVESYLQERGYQVVYREHDQVHPFAGGHFFPYEEIPALMEWLEDQKRVPLPHTITIVRDRDHTGRTYWIRIDEIDPKVGSFWASETDPAETRRLGEGIYARIEARIQAGNLIDIQTRNVLRFTVILNDSLVDFNRPVRVMTNGELSFEGMLEQHAGILLEEARRRPDPKALVSAAIEIVVNE